MKLCRNGHNVTACGRNSYGACRDCHRAKGRKYVRSHRVQSNLNQKNWVKKNPIRASWKVYRTNAKKRAILFQLTWDEFRNLLVHHCYYCGLTPGPINGLDRVDNEIGYTLGNVVTCCTWCNLSKRERSTAEFRDWAIRLGNNLQRLHAS